MTKPGTGPDDQNPPEGEPGKDGPSPELIEQFRQFETRVDEAVRLIGELRQQQRVLEAKLEEANRARAEAARRIDALIDKIDGLL